MIVQLIVDFRLRSISWKNSPGLLTSFLNFLLNCGEGVVSGVGIRTGFAGVGPDGVGVVSGVGIRTGFAGVGPDGVGTVGAGLFAAGAVPPFTPEAGFPFGV